MTRTDEVVITAARRTPIGAFLGALAEVPATRLGAAVLASASHPRLPADQVLMGCVLSAGLGQAPARQAALQAGLPEALPCTTVNKVCGSGMQAVILGHDLIRAGSAVSVLAGGMESMSRAPYLLTNLRRGHRWGHSAVLDHLFLDGLENPADRRLMGSLAEDCARAYGLTRAEQDAYALESLRRTRAAASRGAFAAETVPVAEDAEGRAVGLDHDEPPERADPARVARLPPAFREGGTITAANASSLADGAAALGLARASEAARAELVPLARLVAHATHAQSPETFTTAPIGAIRGLLERAGWRPAEVDLFEINEAFACVALAVIRELGLAPERVNVHGGACALGHPIGASGARILVTLIHALREHGLRRGVAALCIGGGEATAVAVERL